LVRLTNPEKFLPTRNNKPRIAADVNIIHKYRSASSMDRIVRKITMNRARGIIHIARIVFNSPPTFVDNDQVSKAPKIYSMKRNHGKLIRKDFIFSSSERANSMTKVRKSHTEISQTRIKSIYQPQRVSKTLTVKIQLLFVYVFFARKLW
jgi:hypothetical protein